MISYDQLSLPYCAFALALAAETIPRSPEAALLLPHWKTAMDEEYSALVRCGTWDLVNRPADTNIVSYHWVSTLKYNPDGTIHCYKA